MFPGNLGEAREVRASDTEDGLHQCRCDERSDAICAQQHHCAVDTLDGLRSYTVVGAVGDLQQIADKGWIVCDQRGQLAAAKTVVIRGAEDLWQHVWAARGVAVLGGDVRDYRADGGHDVIMTGSNGCGWTSL